jgi:hypothetical protein
MRCQNPALGSVAIGAEDSGVVTFPASDAIAADQVHFWARIERPEIDVEPVAHGTRGAGGTAVLDTPAAVLV